MKRQHIVNQYVFKAAGSPIFKAQQFGLYANWTPQKIYMHVHCGMYMQHSTILRKFTLRSATPYPLRSCIWNTSRELTEAASRVRLCLPLPPTPTSSAFPRGDSRIRLIRHLKHSITKLKYKLGPILLCTWVQKIWKSTSYHCHQASKQ